MIFDFTEDEALEINRMCNLLRYTDIRNSLQKKISHQLAVNEQIEEEAKK